MSRCGESGLFESRHSVKNKKLFHQTVKELFVVGVSLKDLWKSSSINGLQVASKAFILKIIIKTKATV